MSGRNGARQVPLQAVASAEPVPLVREFESEEWLPKQVSNFGHFG